MKHKTIRAALAAAAMILLCALLLCGCDTGSADAVTTAAGTEPEVTTENELEKVIDIITAGKTQYSLIRPDEADETTITAGKTLISAISSFTGARITYGTDFVVNWNNGNAKISPYEILLGKTNRPETAQALQGMRARDYFVGLIGTKLVIAGTTPDATSNAVEAFINKLLMTKCKRGDTAGSFSMCANENVTFTFTNYKVKSCRLLGRDISEYSIVYPNGGVYSAERMARVFADDLTASSGYALDVLADKKAEDGPLIVFGETAFGGKAVASRHGFEIRAEGNKLYVNAECLVGWSAASVYLAEKLFASGDVDIPDGFAYSDVGKITGDGKYYDERTGEYRVIFNNILGNCDTAVYPTGTRNQMAAELHIEFAPDVVALQECSPNSRGSMSYVTTMKNHGYTEVAVKITNSNTNNYTPLLYRADVLDVTDSGYLLYDDGAGDKSKSITWAVFKGKKDGDVFAVFSTHFYYTSDAAGNAARVIDARQITELAKTVSEKYNCPVIAGGDLNCNLSSEPYRNLLNGGWTDAQPIAAVTENLRSWHSYPEYNATLKYYDTLSYPTGEYSAAIDHCILYNPAAVKISLFNIVTEEYALLSADHCPVLVDFNIN